MECEFPVLQQPDPYEILLKTVAPLTLVITNRYESSSGLYPNHSPLATQLDRSMRSIKFKGNLCFLPGFPHGRREVEASHRLDA